MAKAIGLSRKIKLQWLNKAVDLLGENLTEEEYKAKMNEYLSFEIESPTVLRKTREILMRVWFYEDDVYVAAIRKDALDLIKKYPDYDVAIHWCMLLAVYPVFVDLSRLMGRIAEFNDVITLSQLKQKLYDEWGERSTLYHSTDKIIATIKELSVITSDRPGNYMIVKHTVIRPNVVNFMEGLDKQGKFVFLSEPQIWYNVGKLFGVPNLHVGGEVELSCNFAGYDGFYARPCLGTKWVF